MQWNPRSRRVTAWIRPLMLAGVATAALFAIQLIHVNAATLSVGSTAPGSPAAPAPEPSCPYPGIGSIAHWYQHEPIDGLDYMRGRIKSLELEWITDQLDFDNPIVGGKFGGFYVPRGLQYDSDHYDLIFEMKYAINNECHENAHYDLLRGVSGVADEIAAGLAASRSEAAANLATIKGELASVESRLNGRVDVLEARLDEIESKLDASAAATEATLEIVLQNQQTLIERLSTPTGIRPGFPVR